MIEDASKVERTEGTVEDGVVETGSYELDVDVVVESVLGVVRDTV